MWTYPCQVDRLKKSKPPVPVCFGIQPKHTGLTFWNVKLVGDPCYASKKIDWKQFKY
jgi:hypothetical protein